MLNYVWIGLVVIGVLAAAGSDIYDSASDRYRNGQEFEVAFDSLAPGSGNVKVSGQRLAKFYGAESADTTLLQFPATTSGNDITLKLGELAPQIWKTIAETAGDATQLTAHVDRREGSNLFVVFPKTSLVKTKAVLDAVISYSKTAVEIAIGLIGVMAFWLGIMKLAEDSGLIKIIARVMQPVMVRLFPDIPPDHPAMGSIIMNVAANILGLSNAATPLGLKAMEELDELNPKKGIATNAMVTFLAINTAGLTLIPATAIAVRAALGSKDPTIILMTSFFGAGLATIAGIAASKILQRLKVYRSQITPESK
ncbi:MAG TPA: nucleoside recognition domain-containing protein [Candidatus Kryptonia bacterium]